MSAWEDIADGLAACLSVHEDDGCGVDPPSDAAMLRVYWAAKRAAEGGEAA